MAKMYLIIFVFSLLRPKINLYLQILYSHNKRICKCKKSQTLPNKPNKNIYYHSRL